MSRIFLKAIVVLVFLITIIFIVSWLVIPTNILKFKIETLINKKLNVDTHICQLNLYWRNISPTIEIIGLKIKEKKQDKCILNIPNLQGTVSWQSLLHLKLKFNTIKLYKPSVIIQRKNNGTITLAGIPIYPSISHNQNNFGDWLLNQNSIKINNGILNCYNDNLNSLTSLIISNINLTISNYKNLHDCHLTISIANSVQIISLQAQFYHGKFDEPTAWQKWIGRADIKISGFKLNNIKNYISNLSKFYIYDGSINQSLSLFFVKGQMTRLAGKIDGYNLFFTKTKNNQLNNGIVIPQFKTLFNLYYKKNIYTVTLKNLHIEILKNYFSFYKEIECKFIKINQLVGILKLNNLNHSKEINISSDLINIDSINNVIQLLPLHISKKIVNIFYHLQPHGFLRNFKLFFIQQPVNLSVEKEIVFTHSRNILPNHFIIQAYVDKLSTHNISYKLLGLKKLQKLKYSYLPGFNNFSGLIKITENGGQAIINTKNIIFTLKNHLLSSQKIYFDYIFGKIIWNMNNINNVDSKNTHLSYEVYVKELNFKNNDIKGKLTAHLSNNFSNNFITTLNLYTYFDEINISKIIQYFSKFLVSKLSNYVNNIFITGISKEASINLTASFNDAVSKNKKIKITNLIVNFPLKNTCINLKSHELINKFSTTRKKVYYPILQKINGNIFITNNNINFYIANAQYKNLYIKNIISSINFFNNYNIKMFFKGQGYGVLTDILSFIKTNNSLKFLDNQIVKNCSANGNILVQVTLIVPYKEFLKKIYNHMDVKGKIYVNSRKIIIPGFPTIRNMQSCIHFMHKKLLINTKAHLFDGNIYLYGTILPTQSYNIQINGSINTTNVFKELHDLQFYKKLKKYFLGTCSYHFLLKGSFNKIPTLTGHINLNNMRIKLPAYLSQSFKASSLPVFIKIRPINVFTKNIASKYIKCNLILGHLNMIILYKLHNFYLTKEDTNRNIINKFIPTIDKDFTIIVKIPFLDCDAWRNVLFEINQTNNNVFDFSKIMKKIIALIDIKIKINKLLLFSYYFNNVFINTQLNKKKWQIGINSEQLNGCAYYTNNNHKLFIKLNNLIILPEIKQDKSVSKFKKLEIFKNIISNFSLAEKITRFLSEINLVIKNIKIGNLDLGHIDILIHSSILKNHNIEWILNKLFINNLIFNLRISGIYTLSSQKNNGRLISNFYLHVFNSAILLDYANLTQKFNFSSGLIEGNTLFTLENNKNNTSNFKTIKGNLKLQLENGHFVKIYNSPIIKFFSLLNLFNFHKILNFRYNQLFSNGLPFNKITANFTINKGSLYTNNCCVDTPIVIVLVRGKIDILNKCQILYAKIIPNINLSMLSLASLLFDPIFGFTTLAAQILFLPVLTHNLTSYYQVTGTWNIPNVMHISNYEYKR